MKIYFKTFGCKVNQCETNDMAAKVVNAGCRITASPSAADAVIINSCTVTSNADRKAKQYLRKCRRIDENVKIFLTGCLVDRKANELKKEFPDINVFKNSAKENILKILSLELLPTSHSPLPAFGNRTRAFVKIQDGCDGKCSYCIVPKVRPELRSKKIDDIILEIKNYASAGHKEIVLCGIRLGKYKGLADLINESEKIKGLCRIRLSSIELGDITDGLIELMSKSKKLCRHFHIPLQSGDDRILKDMNRPYTPDKYFNKIKKIRKAIPDVGITTDIIIGYPTDTEKTLKNSYFFVKKCAFSRLHIFKFSERPGTSAVRVKKVCPPPVVKKWQEKFGILDAQLRKNFLKKFSGIKLEVLTESNGYGYTSNYLHIKLPSKYPENIMVNI